MLICMALGGYWLFQVATPRYTATAVVALENRKEQIVDLGSVVPGLGGDRMTVNTQVEVLKARGLLSKLVVKLDLTKDPEFNKHIRPPSQSVVSQLERAVKALILGPVEEKPKPSARRVMDDTVEALTKVLSIKNMQFSYVYEITIQTEDPKKSALIADTLAELYISEQIAAKFQANDRATRWMASQVQSLETELKSSENAVKEFTSKANLINEEALARRRGQLKEFRARRADLMAGLNTLVGGKGLKPGQDGEAVQKQLEALDARTRTKMQRDAVQVAALDKSIAELETQVNIQSGELLQLRQLERVAAANKVLYEYFLSRLKEISVQRGIEQADSRVLSAAVLPSDPSSPRKALALGTASILGFFLGCALVLVREMRNATLRNAEDLERLSGRTVFGEIARAPTSRRRRLLDYIVSRTTSPLSEAVRNLRTSILMASVGTPPQIIMLSSSMPGEGKTTLSLSLAHSLASMKKKVLLIEGDIRRRTLKEYFKAKETDGLLAAVSGEKTLEDVVHKSDKLGADVLMGEDSKSNAADFFTSDKFRAFVTDLRARYDYIVIDTPPVLVVPDARVIGSLSDFVLYVVHWDRTTQRQIRQGLKSFATANVTVNGLALTQVDQRRLKSYGYGDGYGSYSNGYY